jgi:hypothetical protein
MLQETLKRREEALAKVLAAVSDLSRDEAIVKILMCVSIADCERIARITSAKGWKESP